MNTEYKELALSQGKVALVDASDYERVAQWSWHFDGRYARGYPHGVKEYLHRYIMRPKTSQVVDHINGDRLDCRRNNLRNCSKSVNSSNQHTVPRNKHGLRGVYKVSDRPGYRAEIYYQGKRYTLGTHETPELANKAYLDAKEKLHTVGTL
jgi:hypothetical protein